MKKTILVLKDKDGNYKDPKTGLTYGWYPKNERRLCEKWCEVNNLEYEEKTIEIW